MSTGCLFCEKDGPFTTGEHIIPASLGNDDLILVGQVCDACQRYFGTEIESYVLNKTPIAAWRAKLGIKTKKGKLPKVDLSIKPNAGGLVPEYSPVHDNGVGFAFREDQTCEVTFQDPEMHRRFASGEKKALHFVISPRIIFQMGRFLGKIGIELLAKAYGEEPHEVFPDARSEVLDPLRRYVREGLKDELWPIFHRMDGKVEDLYHQHEDELGPLEDVVCYDYALAQLGPFLVMGLRVGLDFWVLCMNEQFPDLATMQSCFEGGKIDVLWYPRESWDEQWPKSGPPGSIDMTMEPMIEQRGRPLRVGKPPSPG